MHGLRVYKFYKLPTSTATKSSLIDKDTGNFQPDGSDFFIILRKAKGLSTWESVLLQKSNKT